MVRIAKLFGTFLNNSKISGFLLIACTMVSLLLANSDIGEFYQRFWEYNIGIQSGKMQLHRPVEFWINDGLMTVFFVSVGLEIKRELYIGELSQIKKALLPVFAAIGGMVFPALIHFALNRGTITQAGFGIPMATDIAFTLGALSLVGNRVPATLKIFLTAFAIIDDLGAIIVIAIFYTDQFSSFFFMLALSIWACLFLMNRFGVHSLLAYSIPAIALWYCVLQSGVHATISGVLFAFSLPFGDGSEKSCSGRLQKILHRPVALVILPLFALANTCVVFPQNWIAQLSSRNSLGILIGLIVGKPVGIMAMTFTAVKLNVCNLSKDLTWPLVTGAALLGGMGFTMSIFITLLAFEQVDIDANSKIAIFIASLTAAVLGRTFFKMVTSSTNNQVPQIKL